MPCDVATGAAHDEHLLDLRAFLHCVVDCGLQWAGRASAVTAIGGDDDFGLCVVRAAGECFGREPTKHHGVRSTQASACEHRDDGLGDHRHVDHHAITGPHAEFGECVRCLTHELGQVGVGDGAGVARLAFPVIGDLVAVSGFYVAVEAVHRCVQPAADEPLREWRVTPVEHLGPRLRPGQALRLLLPESKRVLRGLCVDLLLRDRIRSKLRWRIEPPCLVQQVRQAGFGNCSGHDAPTFLRWSLPGPFATVAVRDTPTNRRPRTLPLIFALFAPSATSLRRAPRSLRRAPYLCAERHIHAPRCTVAACLLCERRPVHTGRRRPHDPPVTKRAPAKCRRAGSSEEVPPDSTA